MSEGATVTAERRTAGTENAESAEGTEATEISVGLAAVFLPAPLPRDGRIAFYDPEGDPVEPLGPADPTDPTAPAPEPAPRTRLAVTRPHGAGVRRRTVSAHFLPLDEA